MIIITQASGKRQVDLILDYMVRYGSITGLECIEALGVLNYKGRVHDLRKAGYTIQTKWETGQNRRGEKTTYARYYLKGVPKSWVS